MSCSALPGSGMRAVASSPHCVGSANRSCRRYFHRTGGTYRAGTFKGLDITIGTDEKNYGGILIRSKGLLLFLIDVLTLPTRH